MVVDWWLDGWWWLVVAFLAGVMIRGWLACFVVGLWLAVGGWWLVGDGL